MRSLLLLALLSQPAPAPTRMLTQPAVAGDKIVFAYAGDLWTVGVTGGDARRLTSAVGDETNPVLSPDGAWLAFSANYDGNVDVYVMPSNGGVPTRLTWHPGDDLAQAFSPDGKSVLFTSPRAAFTARYSQLYEVPVTGGPETRVPIPNAARASYSPSGGEIAYNPLGAVTTYPQWKRYRGGASARIWIYQRQSQAVEKIPQPATGGNDTDPVWNRQGVVFRSDRDGEFNLYQYDPASKQVRRLTRHDDFPVLAAAGDPATGRIVYEQSGYLHLLEPGASASKRIPITAASELRETRPRMVSGARYFRNASISPSGERVALEFRGEIVTLPARNGDPRNLTQTPGAHERSPAWSPDGRRIAWVSDESGENQIVIAPADGKGERRAFTPAGGKGYYANLLWSPNGERLAYSDNSQSAYILDVASGAAVRVGGNVSYTPADLFDPGLSWSPDSKWLAYKVNVKPLNEVVFLYSVDRRQSTAVTDGLAGIGDVVFDRRGEYLYLLASTDAGPLLDWFAQSSEGLTETRAVYAVALRNDVANPVAKRSDEELAPRDSAPPAAAAPPFRVDWENLESRIVMLPIPPGQLSRLEAGPAGTFYYLRTVNGVPSLARYRVADRKDETLLAEVADYRMGPNGTDLLYSRRSALSLVKTAAPTFPGDAASIPLESITVRIDPRAEWAQMYDDAWRINRDYFYTAAMHGADWNAVKAKYAAFLPSLTTRADLNRLLTWMGSELSVGHHYITAFGDRLETPTRVSGGLLGADYEVAGGRYRFAKIYGGLNWNGDLRAPLREPAVDVRVGEYLLGVNGRDLRVPANVYGAFEGTEGKITSIQVGPNADGSGSRTVSVVPIGSELPLRYRSWIEGNRHRVDSLSRGRLAYVYVPNTAGPGYTEFRRYFYPQADKEGIIVDERYNGGGATADYYIEALRREPLVYWATRHGGDLPMPAAAIAGPKAMLINETAGSGGDLLPWMFRKFKLGTLIGKRTWGGLVGILGYPVLMDGGVITAPDFAAWTKDEGWIVENQGVPPDVEVEQLPVEVAAGKDPQLDRAVATLMAALPSTPQASPKRPAPPTTAKP